ncbi:SymE family type I addiction module toxin [Providencia huaxiensis]
MEVAARTVLCHGVVISLVFNDLLGGVLEGNKSGVKTRHYTVGYLPNRGEPNPSPQLTISGKWLKKELGFDAGSHYTLTRQVGQIIIRLAEGMR